MKPQTKDYILVGIQFVLFGAYVFPIGKNFSTMGWVHLLGLFFTVFGIAMVIFAILQMKNTLTAFPTPKHDGELITNGIFAFWRHPIYAGIIYASFGFALFWGSFYRIIVAFILLLLFRFKIQYEEKRLSEKYQRYDDYKRKTGLWFPIVSRISKN